MCMFFKVVSTRLQFTAFTHVKWNKNSNDTFKFHHFYLSFDSRHSLSSNSNFPLFTEHHELCVVCDIYIFALAASCRSNMYRARSLSVGSITQRFHHSAKTHIWKICRTQSLYTYIDINSVSARDGKHELIATIRGS